MTQGIECICMGVLWSVLLVFVAWPAAFAFNVIWILLQVIV
jgi:hypothetical protein